MAESLFTQNHALIAGGCLLALIIGFIIALKIIIKTVIKTYSKMPQQPTEALSPMSSSPQQGNGFNGG